MSESGFGSRCMSVPFSGRPLKVVIDKKAFRSNIQVAQQIAPESELLVVIKADAYGHGLLEMMEAVGSHDLAVAIPEELACLSREGIKNQIWVLEGPFSASCLLLSQQASVIWVIHSLWQLELIASAGLALKIRVCLKLDTGMHRLGLSESELVAALHKLKALDHVELFAVMSHFAESDHENSIEVRAQIANFDARVDAHDLRTLPMSLANSGGIMFYPESHRQYVRPGIMLYGGMPNSKQCAKDKGLRAVMTFESAIISLRRVTAGESVGYGSRWLATRDSVIATIAGGYADGYPRLARDGTPVGLFIAENELEIAPLVGQVSMDMITIDVTDIPEAKVGMLVELWGKNIAVDVIASCSNTISYDLLTAISQRVPRSYI